MATTVTAKDSVVEIDTSAAASSVESLIKQLIRLQLDIVTLPLTILPTKTRTLAIDTFRQAFKTVRTVVDDFSDTIDKTLTKTLEKEETAPSK
jgi:hypothetical protein